MSDKKTGYIIAIISVFAGIIAAVMASTVRFENTCQQVRQNVLRLHVIANSDTDFDQTLKLKVRDRILSLGGELFDGSTDVKNAEEKLREQKNMLEMEAEKLCRQEHTDYKVTVEVEDDIFPTRTYDTVTLPAGKYKAVKVTIGEGEGHNWWCVMFPPMCLPAAQEKTEIEDVINEGAVKLVTSDPKIEVRFKLVEWYQMAKNRLSSSN